MDNNQWIPADKALPLLTGDKVLVVTDEGTVMTLSGIKCCDWAARGMIRWWMEIPAPPEN